VQAPQSSGGYVVGYPTPMPGPVPQGIQPPYASQEMTPPPGSPFGAMPPKKDERRPLAIWLVALGAIALLAVIGFVAWPQLNGGGDAPASGVGVVVVTPTTSVPVPTTTVELAPVPPTSVAVVPDVDTVTHRPHRHAPSEPTTHEDPVAPPPTTAPPGGGGDGYLSLITSPWTHVTEGSHDLGDTPLVRVPLSAGHHSLHLVNSESGIRETYDVDITAGETTSRRLGLQ
jgi:hypothetical protein